ncbi:MAG: hypothetical protein PHF86_12350 [Candidatus Nanoarchaeia archaeon]|nr:hypothetical protein [Candidatus Nanoarchaeia archaeon]
MEINQIDYVEGEETSRLTLSLMVNSDESYKAFETIQSYAKGQVKLNKLNGSSMYSYIWKRFIFFGVNYYLQIFLEKGNIIVSCELQKQKTSNLLENIFKLNPRLNERVIKSLEELHIKGLTHQENYLEDLISK